MTRPYTPRHGRREPLTVPALLAMMTAGGPRPRHGACPADLELDGALIPLAAGLSALVFLPLMFCCWLFLA